MLLVGSQAGLVDLDGGDEFITGASVSGLARGRDGWYALVDSRRVVRVDGASAVAVGELPEADGQSLAVLADGRVAVGRRGARVAVVGERVEELRSFEAVPGRDDWENPANPTPDLRSMAVDGDRLFVNVHVGGLWWSDDGGEEWQNTIEPDADIHEVVAADGVVAVAAAIGFGWSRDRGETWAWTTEGLHAGYLRAAAVDGDAVVVSASDGPFTRRGAVYRAEPGAPFTKFAGGLPDFFPDNIDTGALDASGGRVAFGVRGAVYSSEDHGRSWVTLASGLPSVRAVRLDRG